MELSPTERLGILLNYVPTGTTEGEEHILQEAFVQVGDFQSIITPPPRSPRLLVGKKGSGKTAIINFASRILTEGKVPHVKIKPFDINVVGMLDAMSVGQLTKIAYLELLRAIAATLGSQMSGLITGDDKKLYDEAKFSGLADQDLVSQAAELLPKIAKPFAGVDLTALLPNTDRTTCKELEKAITQNVKLSDSAFFLFIDDTDQIASPGITGHFNRIWAMLLATRELTSRIPQLRCLVSLRDEIWRSLTNDPGSQRDQTDHFTPLIKSLNPDLDDVQRIIDRRLELAAAKCGQAEKGSSYALFFAGQHPRMPTSKKTTTWPDVLRSRSRRRPRDAVQLLNMLVKQALEEGDRIGEQTLAWVMPQFSEERVSFLSQEFELECPSLHQIIRSFGGVRFDYSSFTATSDALLDHLRSLPSSFSIQLRGETIHPDDDGQMMRLWNFLFNIGFIYPRVSDERQSKGYRHVNPEDEPLFVHPSKWNAIQACVWEVHPAFRDFIIRVSDDEKARFGLPKIPPKKRGR